MPDNTTSPWLAGLRLDDFEGTSPGIQIASAADAINADILSPAFASLLSTAPDSSAIPEYVPFTTKEMVDRAHHLGQLVKPWTVQYSNSYMTPYCSEHLAGQPT